MSPKVSITIPATELAELLKAPRVRLVEAVVGARRRGIWMRRGEPGVSCGLAEWRVDHGLQPSGVTVLGALLLLLQPDPVDGEEEAAAAARALGVSVAWVEGAEDGWNEAEPSPDWLRRPDADLYNAGYEVGAELRALHQQQRGR